MTRNFHQSETNCYMLGNKFRHLTVDGPKMKKYCLQRTDIKHSLILTDFYGSRLFDSKISHPGKQITYLGCFGIHNRYLLFILTSNEIQQRIDSLFIFDLLHQKKSNLVCIGLITSNILTPSFTWSQRESMLRIFVSVYKFSIKVQSSDGSVVLHEPVSSLNMCDDQNCFFVYDEMTDTNVAMK